MRILMVYQTARIQSSSAVFYRRARALARVLAKHGNQVLIVVPVGEAEPGAFTDQAGCRIQEVPLASYVHRSSGSLRAWLSLPASSRHIADVSRGLQSDVVLVSTHDPLMQIEALKAARATSALLIVHVPDSWCLLRRFRRERISPWAKMQLERWVLRRADRVLCVTETHRQLVRDGYGLRDEQTAILRNGIDLNEWPALTVAKTADLVHIGPIRTYYDGPLLLRSLARLREIRPGITCRFLGVSGAKLAPAPMALAKELGLLAHLEVQDLIAPADMPRAGAAARLGLVSSPPGMECAVFVKLYEYLAMGLPVVVLGDPESENARLVHEHNVGLVCSDERAFAVEVDGLLSDSERLQELSARARRTAALYDYDRTTTEWYNSDLVPLVAARGLSRSAPRPGP